jgi:hypothetical protein
MENRPFLGIDGFDWSYYLCLRALLKERFDSPRFTEATRQCVDFVHAQMAAYKVEWVP